MNNKEFTAALGSRVGVSAKEADRLVGEFVEILADVLEKETVLSVQGFGNFEVKKKKERVVVNPQSKQRMLIPPKLALSFKPSNLLKEKMQ